MISHDLGLVANVCRRVAVMYAGRIVEERGSDDIFRAPRASLYAGPGRLAAAARQSRARLAGTRLKEIAGVVPAITDFPDGCRFNPRCAQATEICRTTAPETTLLGAGGLVQVPSPCMNRGEAWRRRHPQRRGSRGPFSGRRRLAGRRPAAAACGRRRRSRAEARRMPRPRRRIRLRQVDGRAVDPGPAGADARPHRAGRAGGDGRQSGDRKALARIVQMVFQDPYASLNPRQTVRRTLEDPLRLHGVTAKSEIDGPRRDDAEACRPAARTGRPLSA